MNKKLSRGFSDFFFEFSVEEMRRLTSLDWREIIAGAKDFSERHHDCQNCGNKKPKYSFDFKQTNKRRTYHFLSLESYCSLNCLHRYLSKNIKKNELHNNLLYLGSGFKNKVIHNLVWCLEPKELERLTQRQVLALTEERIKKGEEGKRCSWCGKKDKRLQLDIFKLRTNGMRNIAYGDFCSKGCLKNFVEGL